MTEKKNKKGTGKIVSDDIVIKEVPRDIETFQAQSPDTPKKKGKR